MHNGSTAPSPPASRPQHPRSATHAHTHAHSNINSSGDSGDVGLRWRSRQVYAGICFAPLSALSWPASCGPRTGHAMININLLKLFLTNESELNIAPVLSTLKFLCASLSTLGGPSCESMAVWVARGRRSWAGCARDLGNRQSAKDSFLAVRRRGPPRCEEGNSCDWRWSSWRWSGECVRWVGVCGCGWVVRRGGLWMGCRVGEPLSYGHTWDHLRLFADCTSPSSLCVSWKWIEIGLAVCVSASPRLHQVYVAPHMTVEMDKRLLVLVRAGGTIGTIVRSDVARICAVRLLSNKHSL